MLAERFFDTSRANMHRRQIAPQSLSCRRLKRASHTIARHLFLPPELRHHAYTDCISYDAQGKPLFPCSFVTASLNDLALRRHERVLVIGGGYGYEAALCASLCKDVFILERDSSRCSRIKRCFHDHHLNNVRIICASSDYAQGYRSAYPYDVILISDIQPDASVPAAFINQCREGGRIRHMTASDSAVLRVYISTVRDAAIEPVTVSRHYLPERYNG